MAWNSIPSTPVSLENIFRPKWIFSFSYNGWVKKFRAKWKQHTLTHTSQKCLKFNSINPSMLRKYFFASWSCQNSFSEHFQRCVVVCGIFHFFLNFWNQPFYLNGNIYGSLENIFLHAGVVRIHLQNISRGVWCCVVLCVFLIFS